MEALWVTAGASRGFNGLGHGLPPRTAEGDRGQGRCTGQEVQATNATQSAHPKQNSGDLAFTLLARHMITAAKRLVTRLTWLKPTWLRDGCVGSEHVL